ncbi:MAG: hypothetical protein QG657_169 [Acidobacteriota bacterium]|nr:hypothetical protein [Acidobacteriota bacterium]
MTKIIYILTDCSLFCMINSKPKKGEHQMMKKALKVFLVLLMLVGIVFSVANFVSHDVSAYAIDGKDIVDGNGNAIDCEPIGIHCKIVTPNPPKD